MKNIYLLLLLTSTCFGCSKQIANNLKTVKTDTLKIDILFNGQIFPWEISSDDDLAFPFTGKANEIGFITPTDTLEFKLAPGNSFPIQFIINQKDTVVALVIGKSNPAKFNEEYIQQHKGKYTVHSPKVHELINIAVALTNIGKTDSNMVYMESDYYKEVIEHFDKHKKHELIDSLNQHITEIFGQSTYNYYYNIRMNACMYSFKDKNIVNKSPYIRLSFGATNYLTDLLPLVEDFAKTSDFENFYAKNEGYYKSLINQYYDLSPIDKMWQWVEHKFPQKYESYKIYFSPLIGGAHSTRKFSTNEFKETVMFIDAPIFLTSYSSKEKEAILTRVVFTEIDHNYVNPTTDKFTEISTLLQPLECWNSGKQGYQNSYATFNEYMTWAVFTPLPI